MELKHVIEKNGAMTFRRRPPKDVAHSFPKTFFQVPVRAKLKGAALVKEHVALLTAFERMVIDAREGREVLTAQEYADAAIVDLEDPKSELDKWKAALSEAQQMVEEIRGPSSEGGEA